MLRLPFVLIFTQQVASFGPPPPPPPGENVTVCGSCLECAGAEHIAIPGSVITLLAASFRGCNSIVTVVIPPTVSTIYDGTFAGCTSLRSVEVLASTSAYIGYKAFPSCFGYGLSFSKTKPLGHESWYGIGVHTLCLLILFHRPGIFALSTPRHTQLCVHNTVHYGLKKSLA